MSLNFPYTPCSADSSLRLQFDTNHEILYLQNFNEINTEAELWFQTQGMVSVWDHLLAETFLTHNGDLNMN